MAEVDFDAKTNWAQDETVMPADANRWEQGIKDCADATNEKLDKAGGTIIGPLKIAPGAEIQIEASADEEGNYYIKPAPGGQLRIYGKSGKGIYLEPLSNYAPYFYTGQKSLRLLTMFDYTAATNLTSFTADRDYLGYIRNNEHQYTVTIDGQEVARFMPSSGYIPNVSTPILIPAGSVVSITGSASVMVKFPLIGG